jgi:hypothetical protein
MEADTNGKGWEVKLDKVEQGKKVMNPDGTFTKDTPSTGRILLVAALCFILGAVVVDVFDVDFINQKVAGGMTLIVLDSQECTTCDPSGAVSYTQQNLHGVEITYVDAASSEGKELINAYNIKVVPAFLFSETVAGHENFGVLEPYADKNGDKYVLRPEAAGSSWILDPTERAKAEAELAAKKAAAQECLLETMSADTVIFLHSSQCPHCLVMKPTVEKLTQYKWHMAETVSGEGMAPINECLTGLTSGAVPEFICVGTLESAVGELPEADLEKFAAACG